VSSHFFNDTMSAGTRSQEGDGTSVEETARTIPTSEQASTFAASDQRLFPGNYSAGLRHPLDPASSLQTLAAVHRENASCQQVVSPFAALGWGDNASFFNPTFSNNYQSATRSNELSDTMLRYQALSQLQFGRPAQHTPSIFGSMLASSSASQQSAHPASSRGGASQRHRQPQSIGLSSGSGGGLSPYRYNEPDNRFTGEAIQQLLIRQQIAGQRVPAAHYPNPLLRRQLVLSAGGLAQQSAPQSNQSSAWFGNSSSLRADLLYGGRQQSSGLAAAGGAGSLLSSQQTTAASSGFLSAANTNILSEEDQRQQFGARLGPDGFPRGLPMLIAHPEDKLKLPAHQVFLRHQIEVFRASADDISTHTRGRNKPIMMGQIGIRCRHCAHIPVGRRQKGSTYFPSTTLGLYQAAQNMSTTHLQDVLCSEMPARLRQQFVYLISTKVSSSSGAGRPFWVKSAKKLGLVDTDDGIRFVRDLPTLEKRPSQIIDGSSKKTRG
jgi:hypothetical protein